MAVQIESRVPACRNLLVTASELLAGSRVDPYVAALVYEQAAALMESPERPLMLQLQMPDQPEKMPAVQLLSTALASVYFRAILALDGERKAAASGSKAVN